MADPKTPLRGLGMWIWELSACERGDVSTILEKAQECGIRWLAVKSGNSKADGQVTPDLVQRVRDAGLELAAWWYSVPGDEDEDQQIAQVFGLVGGCDVRHLILDAELEWETIMAGDRAVAHDRRAEAKAFRTRLLDVAGDSTWIADAPWSIPSEHPLFPWEEFAFDARMPQVYWTLAQESFATFATRSDGDWARLPAAASPARCPIGSGFGVGTHPATSADVEAFLTRYQASPAVSLWSWQHLSPELWTMLERRAGAGC